MEKFSGPLARRYGTALFETLRDLFQNKTEELIKANDFIQEISYCFSKKTIKTFQNQSLTLNQKNELLQTVLNSRTQKLAAQKLNEVVFNFFATIIEHKRIAYVPYILDFYFKQSDAYLGIIRADIVSAKPMSSEALEELKENITSNVQKKVVFSNLIDDSLKCGLLIKIGSTHIDASLKSFLTKLNAAVS